MKPTGKAKGGHARAKKLTPARKKEIAALGAQARWGKHDAKAEKKAVQHGKGDNTQFAPPPDTGGRLLTLATLRDEIAQSVLTGLYANIADAQKFANYVMPGVLLPEAFTRMAYTQADEALRLRSL